MKPKPRLIQKEKEKIIYQMPDFSRLNTSAVDKLYWPKGIPVLWLKYDENLDDCHGELDKRLSRKYIARVIYSADRENIRPEAGKIPAGAITTRSLTAEQSLALYLETQAKAFIAPWAGQLDSKYLDEISSFVKEDLTVSKSLCFFKDRSPVGLALLTVLGSGAGLVSWIWFEPALSGAERRRAHALFAGWLRDGKYPQIKSVVHSFNLRSNRFFLKMGFHPQCIAITRRS